MTEENLGISDRCRRCCEAGADHEWRADANGGFFVYRCYNCGFYKPVPTKPSLIRRLFNALLDSFLVYRKKHSEENADNT